MLPTDTTTLGRRLFVLGFQLLFLELVLIRFLPGYIWNLGYFPNLVLLAAFIGFGFGFLLHRRLSEDKSTIIYQALPLVLFGFLLLMIWLRPTALVATGSNVGNSVAGELYWTNTGGYGLENASVMEQTLKFMLWFGGVVAIFFMIGQHMAKYFAKLKPLQAYSLDIAGSLLGIILMMVISYFRIESSWWFAIFLISYVYIVKTYASKALWSAAIIVSVGFTVMCWFMDNPKASNYRFGVPAEVSNRLNENADFERDQIEIQSDWSPYQRVSTLTSPIGGTINTNGIPHQTYGGFQSGEIYYGVHAARKQWGMEPFSNVLIIGSGSGNDVLAALESGAKRIIAVEIDPTIAEYGYLPRYRSTSNTIIEGPYNHPNVKLINDDGRHYIYNNDEKFDLIIFALTDSLVKVSPVANLRLENYLFTDASFKRAAELLNPGGWLILYNYYRENWLIDRYHDMLADAMPPGSAVQVARASDIEDTGSPWKWATISAIKPDGALDLSGTPPPQNLYEGAIPTDDWPFPYVKERTLAPQYLASMLFILCMLGMAFLFVRRDLIGHDRKVNPWFALSFMLMGTAFLLLETKGVIQFSLLFGTTWYNSSFVFFGALVLILLAIRVADKIRSPQLLPIAAALLMVSATVALVLPINLLLGLPGLLRFVLACALMFTPIFFANLIFSVLFRDRDDAEIYFGWNLLGATLGGVLEYLSVVTGYQALGAVVIFCYAIALMGAWKAINREENLQVQPASTASS